MSPSKENLRGLSGFKIPESQADHQILSWNYEMVSFNTFQRVAFFAKYLWPTE